MDFVVYEGENPVLAENKKLGSFTLMNIAPGPSGVPRIETTFKVDENAILTVTAADKRIGNTESIEIRPDKDRLSDEEIIQLSREVQTFPELIVVE